MSYTVVQLRSHGEHYGDERHKNLTAAEAKVIGRVLSRSTEKDNANIVGVIYGDGVNDPDTIMIYYDGIEYSPTKE